MGQTNIHTQPLSGTSLTIAYTDNVLKVSVLVTSGTVTYTGSTLFQGTPSAPLALTTGQGATVTANNPSQPIDGLTIDASSGACDVMLSTL